MCRTVPIGVAVSAALEGTLWRGAVIVSASWQIRPYSSAHAESSALSLHMLMR